ncbi:transposase [Micromonospora vinacea]|uniref:transposase n=1 Tax=Micromonospora vinacea TaxID=709878 RepID=UPI00344E80E8
MTTSGRSRAAQNRSEPGRPPQARLETPRHHRRGRHPLAASLTGGNRHDVTQLLPLVDKIPPVRGIRGRPRQRPQRIYADRGYEYDCYRRDLCARASPSHHPPWHRPRFRTRHPALGRQADLRPAALVPPAGHPLGDPRRHPRSLPHARLRHHLLSPTPTFRAESC